MDEIQRSGYDKPWMPTKYKTKIEILMSIQGPTTLYQTTYNTINYYIVFLVYTIQGLFPYNISNILTATSIVTKLFPFSKDFTCRGLWT